jgi:hypothetical protein
VSVDKLTFAVFEDASETVKFADKAASSPSPPITFGPDELSSDVPIKSVFEAYEKPNSPFLRALELGVAWSSDRLIRILVFEAILFPLFLKIYKFLLILNIS